MASKPEMDRKHEDANPKGPSGKGNRQRDRDRGHGGGGGGGDRGNRNSNSNSGGPPKQNRDRGEQVRDRLIQSGMQNTTHLQTREGKIEPRKFTGRCRLFVGNLSTNITDDEFRKLFEPFGETAEIFLNTSKGFGFVKMDTRQHAEAAKAALDFSMVNGKYLRVRFATHGAALKVKNLSPWVSNELLEYAFSFFGEVERAVVIVDDRGRSLEEGIVEFARKQSAQMALKKCQEGCFMITSSLQPVLVEALEQRDEEDGLPEKNFQKSNPHYMKERNVGPRLADPGSFEFEYGMRWKKLYDIENQKREHLEKEIKEARGQLDDQQEFAIYEHETNALREKLRAMEEQTTLIQRERELRREEDRRREEQRRQEELALRQQEEEILRRRNVEEMRRRQDENMMVQAQLRQQEAVLRGMANDNNQMGQNQFDMQGMNMGGQGGPMMQGGGGMPHSGRFDSPHGDMGPNGNGMGNQQMGMRGSGNMGGGLHIDPAIIATAFLGTCLVFVCFTLSAIYSEQRKWLYLGGTLMSLTSVLLLLGLANIFMGSKLVFQVQLYLGLAVFCAFILYDTQAIIEKRLRHDKDYIWHSVDLFLDFINIFRHILIILMQNADDKKKKKRNN